ncbi:hypothetical protein GFV16_25670 [Bacillus megaterium]|nr:hypothetical protein [Priestia megaterium]
MCSCHGCRNFFRRSCSKKSSIFTAF